MPAEAAELYDLLGDVLGYPRWWNDVFLSASGDAGPPAPGRATSVVARGYLPYRLRFTLTCLEAERPTRIHSRLSGDFEGTGTWLLESTSDGTNVALDWRPAVAKPVVRVFTPVARPLFRSNHSWTMKRGRERVEDALRSRRESSETGT